LWRAINPSKSSGGGGPRPLFLAAADEDDVDDRTSSSSYHDQISRVETEESLIAQWKKYHSEFQVCESAMNRYHGQIQDLLKKHSLEQISNGNHHYEEEEEEKFYRQNEITLLQESFDKYQTRRMDVLMAVKDIEQLFPFVNPKLVYDWKTGYIGTSHPALSGSKTLPPVTSTPPQPYQNSMLPSQAMQPSQEIIKASTSSEDIIMMPPPPKPSQKTIHSNSKSPKDRIIMPPPSAKSLQQCQETIIQNPENTQTDSQNQKPKRQRLVGPALPRCTANLNHKENHTNLPSESDCDNWMPPTDQDGSGRTKYNDRFQGRY
jgi:hypothetical protein